MAVGRPLIFHLESLSHAQHGLHIRTYLCSALDHDTVWVVIAVTGFDQPCGARVALEIPHLLGFRLPRCPHVTTDDDVPEPHDVRLAVSSEGDNVDDELSPQERQGAAMLW